MLTLYEELFLLALNEEKGSFFPFTKKTIVYGLSGAILSELALQGKVCSNEKLRLETVDAAPLGVEILDELLQEIKEFEKPRKLTYWVSHLSEQPKKLRERIGEGLAAKNILVLEEKHYFRLPREASTETPLPPTRYEIKQKLREAILAPVERHLGSLALLSMASASDVLGLVFTQDEIAYAEKQIHDKLLGAALEAPAMETIEVIAQSVEAVMEDEED